MRQTNAFFSHKLSAGSSQGDAQHQNQEEQDQKELKKRRRFSQPIMDKTRSESSAETIASKTRRRLSGECSLFHFVVYFLLAICFYQFSFSCFRFLFRFCPLSLCFGCRGRQGSLGEPPIDISHP